MNLLQGDIKKLFFKYLIPSISATLVTSIYVLADTIMIGKGIGAQGIAALNFILPIFTLFFGTGLLLGVGGAILMAVANGQGDKKTANTYFTYSVGLGLMITVVYMLVFGIWLEPIGYLLGSSESNIHLFMSYTKYLVACVPVFIFSSLLQAFVRNDHAPKRAMLAVIAGGVTNIILDYIFIFSLDMGMKGGAIATVLGSTISVAILLTHFLSKANTMRLVKVPLKLKPIGAILQSGLPSFIGELAAGVVVLLFNLQLLRYVGDTGVVVYSIIANTAIVAMSLFNGVAQAAQPIIATNYGAGQMERVKVVRRIGAITAFCISIVIFLLGFLFPEAAVNIFVHPTPEILAMARVAIRIYFIAFFAMSLNVFYTAYFQSILQANKSFIIGLLRGIIICGILVFILPVFLGVEGIWLVMPITEVITLLIASLFLRRKAACSKVKKTAQVREVESVEML